MPKDRIITQRVEFQAASELSYQYDRLSKTPVVDDDYPMVRHAYEAALAGLIDAMKANERFVPGNRYGVSQ